MRKTLLLWLFDRSGVTAIEYGLLVMGIALAVVAALFLMGTDLSSVFEATGSAAQEAGNRVAQ